MNSLQYTLSEEHVDCRKNSDTFYEVCHNVFNNDAPRKKKYIRGITSLLWLKFIQEICKELVLDTNF